MGEEQNKKSGSGFYLWILSKQNENSEIGKLAKRIAEDEEYPQHAGQEHQIYHYLECETAALNAFFKAWKEYSRLFPQ